MCEEEETYKTDPEDRQIDVKSQHGDREVLVEVGEEKLFIRLFSVKVSKTEPALMTLHICSKDRIYEAALKVPEKVKLL